MNISLYCLLCIKIQGKDKGKIQKLQKQEKEIQQKQAGKAQTTQLKEFSYDNETQEGQKKNIQGQWPQAYNPSVIEQNWYSWWEQSNFFDPDVALNIQQQLYQKLSQEEKEVMAQQPEQPLNFTMLIPPPNRTSNHLHCGHSFTVAIEDALTRFYRQNGYRTSWIPGSDHAGIAAQAVFEKQISKQGLTKSDLGREEFLKQMWQWIDQCGDGIMGQLKLLGTSVDWQRKYFTLDQERNKIHDQAFIKLFNKGLIYRANRLTSWDCTLQTAISDVEVEYIDVSKPLQLQLGQNKQKYPFGYLWSFSYLVVPEQLTGKSDEEIKQQWNQNREIFTEKLTFATTRPETMFGDSAVAIHPEDERYKKFQGRRAFSPLTQSTLPIICDETLVDMNFGTGVVKVTPAHDPNDFLTGQRHKLPQINMLNKNGTIYAPQCPEFDGMYRFDARIKIIKFFTDLQLYEGKTPNKMAIGKSQRSGDIIEQLLVPQWWMNCESAAKKALEAVNVGKLLIIPAVHKRTWEKYLGNIQPWCISRQLWWGHRIPLYKCWKATDIEPSGLQTEDWIAAMNEQEAIQIFRQNKQIQQDIEVKCIRDQDVTDTWFSSGLLPLALSGWPNNKLFTEEYCQTDYKEKDALTSILETGHDIIFFWVARMVMLTLELTNTLPFSEVLLHSMVRDSRGEKMSKSKGNVVDPVDLIRGASLEKLANDIKQSNLIESEIQVALKLQKSEFPLGIPVCGADAQRFCLVSYSGQVQGINLDVNQVVSERNFCNKIFNATKLVCTSCEQMQLNTQQMKSQQSMLLYFFNNISMLSLADKYILYNLLETQHKYTVAILSNDFETATSSIKNYFWAQLCDIYFELVKPTINGENNEQKQISLQIMFFCIDQSIRMLSVFMPYISEEMWQHLPHYHDEQCVESICLTQMLTDVKQCKFGIQNKEQVATDMNCKFYQLRMNQQLKQSYNLINQATQMAATIRSAKASVGIMKKTVAYIKMLDSTQLTQQQIEAIKILSNSENITVVSQEQSQTLQNCISKTENNYTAYADVAGLVDIEKEIIKCQKQKEVLEKSIEKINQLKGKATYEKMPLNVREANEEKLNGYNKQLQEIKAALVQWMQMK